MVLEQQQRGRAYLLKDRVADRGDLSRALQEVAEGRSVIDPRIVETLVEAQQRRESSRLSLLTPREREVLGLIAEGSSNGAIAEQLVITTRAVERHVNWIFWKLDLGDSGDVSRRVKATQLYLSGEDGL